MQELMIEDRRNVQKSAVGPAFPQIHAIDVLATVRKVGFHIDFPFHFCLCAATLNRGDASSI
jgi:hypothetical protein